MKDLNLVQSTSQWNLLFFLQDCVLHFVVCFADPLHLLPPFDGAGLVQVRFLVFRPEPQLLLQAEYLLQLLQLPLT